MLILLFMKFLVIIFSILINKFCKTSAGQTIMDMRAELARWAKVADR